MQNRCPVQAATRHLPIGPTLGFQSNLCSGCEFLISAHARRSGYHSFNNSSIDRGTCSTRQDGIEYRDSQCIPSHIALRTTGLLSCALEPYSKTTYSSFMSLTLAMHVPVAGSKPSSLPCLLSVYVFHPKRIDNSRRRQVSFDHSGKRHVDDIDGQHGHSIRPQFHSLTRKCSDVPPLCSSPASSKKILSGTSDTAHATNKNAWPALMVPQRGSSPHRRIASRTMAEYLK